jgi:DNA-binding NarL/FixJ family response regulator
MNTINVLIADSNPHLRRLLRHYLDSKRMVRVICEANDGREAVEQTIRLQPDWVFMDVHLPRLNGIDAATEIKQLRMPVKVMLLSMDFDEQYRQYAETIADRYIAMPAMKRMLDDFLFTERLAAAPPYIPHYDGALRLEHCI